MGAKDTPLDRSLARVEGLVAELESCSDPAVRDSARELVATLLELHREGISRLLELVEVPKAVMQDPLARGLLLLHGLHPDTLDARVGEALEHVRPSLRAHRGDVELVSLEDGVAHLRLVGTCNGCPSSTLTFRNLIESAIQEYAPEIERIEVEGMRK